MKVYVDNILIQSRYPHQHRQDLEETFKTFQRYNMRLNPKKCAFRVKEGKFPRLMLIKRGIEANPTKCQAIIDMKCSTSIKEVQALNSRLAILTRFISKSANNLVPFFNLLKKL